MRQGLSVTAGRPRLYRILREREAVGEGDSVCPHCEQTEHEPNEETIQALRESEDPNHWIHADVEDLFRKLGI